MQWIDFSKSASQRTKEMIFDNEQIKTKNLATQGHALVRGVAGSGKSLILRDRLDQMITENLDNILVLSYNRYMNCRLNEGVEESSHQSRSITTCKTFHSWAYKALNYSYKNDGNHDEQKNLIEKAKKSNLKYQAILVDEAQDFCDEWFQVLMEVLDPNTDSLFFVYDNAQSIYGKSHQRKSDWTWSHLGVNVPGGRSQIFDINHRNSPEILELAWKFIKPSIEASNLKIAKKTSSPSIEKIIEPRKKSTRSSGISPLLIQIQHSSMPMEIAQQIKIAKENHSDIRIGILLHPKIANSKNAFQSEIFHHLNALGIKPIAPRDSQDRQRNILDPGAIVIDSWNALKGMEFDAVIIAGIDYVSSSEDQDQDFKEKSGLYIAMTRAKDHLVMLYEKETDIVSQINQYLNSADCLESDL